MPNGYAHIIERLFLSRYKPGAVEVPFEASDFVRVAKKLRAKLPANLGDVVCGFRYSTKLPQSVRTEAPKLTEWIIRPAGASRYCFVEVGKTVVAPRPMFSVTKIPESTPGMITRYALSDEQALLAKLRCNRVIDLFTGVVSYSLDSHLRTTMSNLGEVETDEIYVGLDERGAHCVLPVQAAGRGDVLSIAHIERNIAVCTTKFPSLTCRPIGAQLVRDDFIALFEFQKGKDGIRICAERHYRLVRPDQLTADDLRRYREQLN